MRHGPADMGAGRGPCHLCAKSLTAARWQIAGPNQATLSVVDNISRKISALVDLWITRPPAGS